MRISSPPLRKAGSSSNSWGVRVGPAARLTGARHTGPETSLEALGLRVEDLVPERLGGRVAEDPRRGPVPQEDLPGGRVRDDHRVSDPLEDAAYPRILWM